MLLGGLTPNVVGCLMNLTLLGGAATLLHNKAHLQDLWPEAPGIWQTQEN